MMAQIIPEQWLGMERSGFDQMFDITSRCCDAFEKLTALNLQAIRFGLAKTQEGLARTCVADNLPEMLCLPTLLAPAGFAQALSYSRQFFEIMSGLQRHSVPPQPASAARQRPAADDLLGTLATRSLVPSDVPADTTTTKMAAAEPDREWARAQGLQPMHTE
ncbi:TIGR01841 family phasin [Paraburkholderia phytofirmans]|nr:TIGR01841 family phasin [Paraburkholderia phytofirmans]